MDYDKLSPKMKLYTCACFFTQGGTFRCYPNKHNRYLRPHLQILFPNRETRNFFRSVVDPEYIGTSEPKLSYADRDKYPTTEVKTKFLFQVGGYHQCLAILTPMLPYIEATKAAEIRQELNLYLEHLNR